MVLGNSRVGQWESREALISEGGSGDDLCGYTVAHTSEGTGQADVDCDTSFRQPDEEICGVEDAVYDDSLSSRNLEARVRDAKATTNAWKTKTDS